MLKGLLLGGWQVYQDKKIMTMTMVKIISRLVIKELNWHGTLLIPCFIQDSLDQTIFLIRTFPSIQLGESL